MTHRNYRRLDGTVIKSLPANTGDTGGGGIPSPVRKNPGRGTHSSILARKSPWTEELGDYGPWDCKETGLSTEHTHIHEANIRDVRSICMMTEAF